jgi:hypothetical protein
MLEDNKAAKLFLSAIIGEEIIELDYIQNEVTREKIPLLKDDKDNDKDKDTDISLIQISRFDFSAKIKTESGFKTIAIELQRAKFLADLMRFRRYLGLHYQREDNSYKDADGDIHPRQIYYIFFLGYDTNLPPCPVLKVDYSVRDACSGEVFQTTDEFITGLHHVSWVIQIGLLKASRRNRLEQILSIFDQSNALENHQLLDIDDENYPKEYRVILRRLRKAMENYEIRRKMELEDDVLNAYKKKNREVARLNKLVADKDKIIDENNQTIEKNAQDLADANQTITEQGQTIEKNAQDLAEANAVIEALKKQLGLKSAR